MRLAVATCQVDYAGRLTAHLPMATRVLMIKADGSVLVHSDGGSYKPLNWMSPPCSLTEGTDDEGRTEWVVTSRATSKGPEDTLRIILEDVVSDSSHDLGIDPGLRKDGVEKHRRSCSPTTRPPWPRASCWCAASTPPRSARST